MKMAFGRYPTIHIGYNFFNFYMLLCNSGLEAKYYWQISNRYRFGANNNMEYIKHKTILSITYLLLSAKNDDILMNDVTNERNLIFQFVEHTIEFWCRNLI